MRRTTLVGLAVTLGLGCATVEDYVANLSHTDARVRGRAALKLGQAGREAVAPILDTLGEGTEEEREEDATYRKRAFFVLGRIGPRASGAAPVLGRAVRSPGSGRGDAGSRHMAAWALGQIGKAALGEIAQGLRHEDTEVRIASARALGYVGPHAKRLVPELARLMREGAEGQAGVDVRIAAAESAGRIGPWAKAAVPALVGLLADEDEKVRAAAFGALGLVGAHASRAVPDLTELLASEDAAGEVAKNNEVRIMAARTLRRIGPRAAKAAGALAEMLADADGAVRREAMLALAAARSLPAFAARDFLKVLEEYVRGPATRQGGSAAPATPRQHDRPDTPASGHDIAEPPHRQAAASSRYLQAKADSAEMLGEFRKVLVPELLDMAREEDPSTRRRAVWALGMTPSRHAPPALVDALGDEDARVRLEAVRALEGLGPRARGWALAVGMMLTDPDPAVRRAAAEAVGKM